MSQISENTAIELESMANDVNESNDTNGISCNIFNESPLVATIY